MVNKQILYKYLNSLEESLVRIEKMDFTFDMILGDEDVQDLLDRRMQKAIESCINIAAHIVASEKLGQPQSAGDLFSILEKNKMISTNIAHALQKAVSFRNIVVHKYTDVDYRIAYSDLDKKLKDLQKFAGEVKKSMDKL